jgi:hypothetical protein
MTPDLTGPRIIRRARLLVKLAGLSLGLVIGAGFGVAGITVLAAGSASAANAPVSARQAELPLTASTPDNGRRSFGVQPAGAKKPDPRPNFTYQNVKPGQRISDHVAFVNISDKPVTLTVYPADGFNTSAGAFDLLRQSARSTDIGRWVSMKRTTATVPARSALITPIVITIPRNAEPGDHAGGIVASLKTLAKDSKGDTVTVDQRVGTRVYIRVAGKLTPKIDLARRGATYLPPGNPFGRGDADVTYTIRNTGNVRLIGTQVIRVSDVLGSSTQALKVPEMPELLPGESFTFTTRVHKVLPALLLTAHVTIDPRSVAGNVDPALEQANASTRFWAFYWPVLLLLLLVAGEFGRRWWVRRKRAAGSGGGLRFTSDPSPTPDAGPKDHAMATRTASRIARIGLAGVVAVAWMGALALVAGPAQAASGSGGLTFIPAKGMDISPMYVVTPGPCPAQATNLVGRIFGKGFPKAGVVVIPNSDAAVRHDVGFGVPLQDTIQSFAQQAGIKLTGKYRIAVQCTNELGTKVFAEFSGTVDFSSATHFTGPAPKTPPAEGVPVGFLAQVFPEFKQGSGPTPGPAAPGKSAGKAAKASGAAQSGGATAPADDAQSTSSITSSAMPFVIIILIAGAVGAIGFVATSKRGGGPRSGATAGPPVAVEWPDDDEKPLVSAAAKIPAQSSTESSSTEGKEEDK